MSHESSSQSRYSEGRSRPRRRGRARYGRSNLEDEELPQDTRGDQPAPKARQPKWENSEYEMFTREEIYRPPMEHPKGKGPVVAAPKESFFRKLLRWCSFGLLGKSGSAKPASAAKPKDADKPKAPPAQAGARGNKPPGKDRPKAPEQPKNQKPRPESGDRRPPPPQNQNQPAKGRPAMRDDRPAQPASGPPPQNRPAPDAVDPNKITTTKLKVGNLSFEATESDLFQHFSTVVKLKNAEVAMDRSSHRSKGFGYVTLASVEDARKVFVTLNGQPMLGRNIYLTPSDDKPRPQGHPGKFEGGGGNRKEFRGPRRS